MISDVITITRGDEMEAALDLVKKTAAYNRLSSKGALHLSLLTEEMMGMMRSITGESTGKFWIESENGVYKLHLKVDSVIGQQKREQLLDTASTGKNESSKGLMGRLREFFFRNADDQIAAYSSPILAGGLTRDGSRPVTDSQWSMTLYQEALKSQKAEKHEAAEAWDELEKSVVSHVADDVKISIEGWQTEMVIVKKLA